MKGSYSRRMKKIISTTDAPAAIGPYSQAVRVGSTVYCAGQIPLDPKSGQIVSEDITEQTRRVLDNVAGILKAERLTMADVVKTTVFLADFGDFQKMNEVYATYFTSNPPARSTVGVSTLPKNARVEIEVIAVAGADGKSIDDTSG
jgi:2-iminobutanoate/2-iminopropanoate deaminase